jgi:Fe-S-cluster-containing dehydrogenase component
MKSNDRQAGGVRLAMALEQDRCIDCRACLVACKAENGVPLEKSRIWVSRIGPRGKFPALGMHFIPEQCHHCDSPPCNEVCPTGATYRREDGAVLVNKETCIGCCACIEFCPYGARYLDDETETVDKCTFCNHRLLEGRQPACVETCPTRVRHFGDRNDRDSDVHQLISANRTRRLKEEEGTDPQLYYIGTTLER